MGRKLKDGVKRFEGGYRLARGAGGIWRVEYTERVLGEKSKSRSYSTGTADEAAAEAFLIEYRAGLKEVTAGTREAGKTKLTMSTLLDNYRQDCAARGKEKSQGHTLTMLERFFGPYAPDEVTDALCLEYLRQRRAGRHANAVNLCGRTIKDGSLRRDMVVLMSAFHHAARTKTINRADLPYLPMPAKSAQRSVFLTVPEIEDMLGRAMALAPAEGVGRLPRITRFVWLALWTGSRAEALEKLRWEQVDFAGGVIRLHQPGARVTSKRRASIPIAPRLMPMLERARREQVNPFVCDGGECVDTWEKFRASTPYAARGLTRHDLRRSFITRLVSEGVPLAVVAQAVGDTIQMLEKHYIQYAPDFLDNLWSRGKVAA